MSDKAKSVIESGPRWRIEDQFFLEVAMTRKTTMERECT
jgi:hypothetical protein